VEADLADLVDLQAPSLEACAQDAHVGPIDHQEVQVVGLGPFAAANVEAFLAVRLSVAEFVGFVGDSDYRDGSIAGVNVASPSEWGEGEASCEAHEAPYEEAYVPDASFHQVPLAQGPDASFHQVPLAQGVAYL